MANVKNGALREIIIDRCLRSRRGYSTQEIFDRCNETLEHRREDPITSLNTIRNDILAIKNRWHEVVESVRDGRNIRYRYADADFSIYNTPLSEEEIVQLSESVSMLRRFEGMPGFEWVDELNAHIEATVNTNVQPIVGFDENTELKGMEFFTPLFNHIRAKETIMLRYRPYEATRVREIIVHPYYLKEYNQRWFLFGLNDKNKHLSTYALDRIDDVELATVKFVENQAVDFKTYFDDIVGVSKSDAMQKEKIIFLVSKEQLPYILSKPIHKSQELIETRDDGMGIITIELKPNFELTQLLLSFGEHITIVSPERLRNEISSRLEKNLKNYQ